MRLMVWRSAEGVSVLSAAFTQGTNHHQEHLHLDTDT